jgi:hypothetical protein
VLELLILVAVAVVLAVLVYPTTQVVLEVQVL